jgi:hypothetical protein
MPSVTTPWGEGQSSFHQPYYSKKAPCGLQQNVAPFFIAQKWTTGKTRVLVQRLYFFGSILSFRIL